MNINIYKSMNYTGFKKRPTYDELVDSIENDPERIKFPDRRATELRESPYLTQLDGEGMRMMEEFDVKLVKEQKQEASHQTNSGKHRTEYRRGEGSSTGTNARVYSD